MRGVIFQGFAHDEQKTKLRPWMKSGILNALLVILDKWSAQVICEAVFDFGEFG